MHVMTMIMSMMMIMDVIMAMPVIMLVTLLSALDCRTFARTTANRAHQTTSMSRIRIS
jgi:hypothetical protein